MSDSFMATEVTIGGRPEARQAIAERTTGVTDGRFWQIPLQKEGEPYPAVHERAVPWAETLWTAWRPLRRRDREHDAMYENRELRMLGAGKNGAMGWLESVGFDTSSLFVTTGIVDTFAARIGFAA